MASIILKKINHHNFKDVSLEIEKNQFIVVTGPSGSGKSTLVMDIIYAEGQRKFLESLPSYARQFIPLPEKADIGEASGLTPCVIIDQKKGSNTTRSTVGTVSEVYDYVRILYSLIGSPFCHDCQINIEVQNSYKITEQILFKNEESSITVYFSLEKYRKNKPLYKEIIFRLLKAGYNTYSLGSEVIRIRNQVDEGKIIKNNTKKHPVFILYSQKGSHEAVTIKKIIDLVFEYESIVEIAINGVKRKYTKIPLCLSCKKTLTPIKIDQKLFSFNLPTGACPKCQGIGETASIRKINPVFFKRAYNALFSNKTLDKEKGQKNELLGTCPLCHGGRMNAFALSICINKMNIVSFCQIQIKDYFSLLKEIKKNYTEKKEILEKTILEIEKRIKLLIELGLGYLTLWRNSNTLSGGELQRIRLASQLGSGLTGVTYILDEPSIGLHQSDNTKLIKIIKNLCSLENTVIVVEHDEETMKAAQTIIDIGPEAGIHGGKIVFKGTPQKLMCLKNESETGKYLSGKLSLERKTSVNEPKEWFIIKNAQKNNLKNITVGIPLKGILTVVTGISGSGKSTLIFDEFIPQFQNHLLEKNKRGAESIIIVDQKPIGKTNRSTIGTYFGFFDEIRELFAMLPESKAMGLEKGHFSFNTGQYKCTSCKGRGILELEMEPLPKTTVMCDRCNGNRYEKIILDIKYKNKNIFDVLSMTTQQAIEFFDVHKKIKRQLQALLDVGLSYVTLNQGSDTFSGGESQRIKLAFELTRRNQSTTYVLDEPTTGLHFQDIQLLLNIFDKLLEQGSTLIIIEHNMAIIRYADYIIDMGPSGGTEGGYIIAKGTPKQIRQNKNSITGKYI